MANTSTHPITVNGHRLDTWAYNIETKVGWDQAPGMRGANEVAAGRPGQLWVPKTPDVSVFGLSMWVRDTDVDGEVQGADRYYYWRKNLDTILSILDTTYGPALVRRHIGNNEYREALCDNPDALVPEIRGDKIGRFKVAFDVLGAYWQDIADRSWASPSGAGAVGQHNVSSFTGATGTMHGLTLRITGPLINPRVTDHRTGHYVQYNGILSAGAVLVINTETGEATVGATNVQGSITHDGMFNPAMWAMAHASLPTVPPVVRLSGAGAATGTKLEIIGRRKFK